MWVPYGQIRRPCGIFANSGCVNSLTCPKERRTAPLWVTHGPRTGPVGYEKNWRFPCSARTGIARGTRRALRTIQPNHKHTAVSSLTGLVAWCDHEDNTDVNVLRALHSPLRARNSTGAKNRTGSVVGCDWGISKRGHSVSNVALIYESVFINVVAWGNNQ